MSFRRQHIRNTRAVIEAGTPLIGEYPYDTDLKTIRVGDGATLGGHLLKKWGRTHVVLPAQIAADQDDYNPADLAIAEALFLDLAADYSLTGLAGGVTNREITLYNISAFRLTLVNQSAASSAANRFWTDGNLILRPFQGVHLIYSAADARWLVLGRGDLGVTTIPEDFSLTGKITPAQISADQHDYAPAGLSLVSRLRLSSDASREITGLAGGNDGRWMIVANVDTNPIVLKDASVSSTAANRFDFGSDVTLSAKNVAVMQYDGTDSRWKLIASTAGAAVADGAVTASKLSAASAGGNIVNGKLVYSVAASALTIAVKNLAGNDPSAGDPVWVRVRDATASTDASDWVKLTAALSLVVSSGSSLGSINSTAFRIWTVLFNDGGTPRLGVINCLSGTNIYPLGGWPIAGSTAEGGAGAADSAQVFYTGTAVAAKPYAVLGYASWETGLTAAGTWDAAPTRAQMFGVGVPLPGMPIGAPSRTDTGAVASGTGQTPDDDTIPQNTEGDQYLSQAHTPQSAANVLNVRTILQLSHSVANVFLLPALFRDAVADAIAVTSLYLMQSTATVPLPLDARVLAGATGSTTFKVRVGATQAGTVTFNGRASSRKNGGAYNSFIEVEELQG
jgi:hypothetical protein